MTIHNANLATDPALPGDDQATATKARVALFCSITGDEPVKLKVRKGKVYMTDDLLAWCKLTGANLDWLIFGDLRAMIRVYRKEYEAKNPALEVIKQIPEAKLSVFTAALKAHLDGLLPMDQALLALRQALGIDEDAFQKDLAASQAEA
jgi:hypothetical protein